MEDNKNMNATGNEHTDEQKEQQGITPGTPANNETTEKIGVGKKIGSFFKKNGKKIGVGLGIAAAFAGGIAADKFGLPKFGKGEPDQPADE